MKQNSTPIEPKKAVGAIPRPQYDRKQINWRALLFSLALLWIFASLVSYLGWFYMNSNAGSPISRPGPTATVNSPTPTTTLTPNIATPTPYVVALRNSSDTVLSFHGSTVTPTPVPGGNIIIVTPQPEAAGWVVSEDESVITIYDRQNHYGDSYLYAGISDRKIYHGAFQLDLSFIPRGTKIHAASLRLSGLRDDLLAESGQATWQLQLLAPGLDPFWPETNYNQIHQALPWISFEPTMAQTQLGIGEVNSFTFTPAQLELLERRLRLSNGLISFRLDGPMVGKDNLFAWDSGSGVATRNQGPELFLSLGPPPEAPLANDYVMVTNTPTPENILTAVAISLAKTAEAQRLGTATPLPLNWVTPIVVTPTPTAASAATAQVMNQQATAIALTTGIPPNVVTATPTPTFVIITSTPTAENVLTVAAQAIQATTLAKSVGTATPLPPNWVTPVVVTATPEPENIATALVNYIEATAVAIVFGTATPFPENAVTATATATYVIVTSTPTPENVETAVSRAHFLTAEASRNGTATPLPHNWVTPIVVTHTPTPANQATVQYRQAIILTTGTPTPTPLNVQTATATQVYVVIGPYATPTPTITPSPVPPLLPNVLVGKILFLSDRDGATEEERQRAGLLKVTPQPEPKVFVYDPATGDLGRLSDLWPYQVALVRDMWSADRRFRVFTQDGRTFFNGNTQSFSKNEAPTLFWYDGAYNVIDQLTHFGTGIAYDGVWSPTTEQIALVATESGNDEIWVVNRDYTNLQQLTHNEWEWDKHPSWSPNGEQIIFYSNRTGNSQLWIMNKDGSEQRPLMELNPYNDWNPVWVKYVDAAPFLE